MLYPEAMRASETQFVWRQSQTGSLFFAHKDGHYWQLRNGKIEPIQYFLKELSVSNKWHPITTDDLIHQKLVEVHSTMCQSDRPTFTLSSEDHMALIQYYLKKYNELEPTDPRLKECLDKIHEHTMALRGLI